MFYRGRFTALRARIYRHQQTSFVFKNYAWLEQQRRHKTWFNPLSKFNTDKAPVTKAAKKIIIEESNIVESNEDKYISDLKHYLKTNDIPKSLQQRILKEKFSGLINSLTASTINPDIMVVLNSVYIKLYTMNNYIIDDKLLSQDDLMGLFEKTSTYFASLQNNDLRLPEFISILAKHFIFNSHNVSSEFLVHIFEIGKVINKHDFKSTLKLFVETTKANYEFTHALLNHYENKGMLDITLFENIFEVVGNLESDTQLLDDYIFKRLISYVENLYADIPPKVHEYKDLTRNVTRIQSCVISGSKLIEDDVISTGTIINLVKLIYELSTVNSNKETPEVINQLLTYVCNSTLSPERIKLVKKELYNQDLDDESLINCLLNILRSNIQFRELELALRDIIIGDDVRYSKSLRFQVHISEVLSNEGKLSESQVFDKIISEYELYFGQDHEASDHSENYESLLKYLVQNSIVSPRGYLTHSLSEYFIKEYGIEPSLYSYKLRLDKSIELNDYVKAVNIFEDSLSESISWMPENDPAVHKTLNDLIVLLCTNMDDIKAIFGIFTKIRQQMVNTKCNISAINALATKMLKEEFVGDTIEMLKRELPEIKRDDVIKLPIEKSFGHEYIKLFNILHTFVISYEAEKTFETNWVLYGELHKYFHVPFETYLPTMRFFCEHDRYNAALTIFRQIRKLNELHGNHNHLPPSRDMYLYLFETFGNCLYENGVEEVHESMKMDINLNTQDIQLQNSILNAYSNLQDVPKANDLFLAMSSNPKQIGGINEETIQIMIKTYTYSDMMYVKKFWNNLSQYDIVPNYAIYKQYIIANSYHGLIEDAFKLIDEMKDYELEVSPDTLLALHNFSLETSKQKKIAEWAQKNYSKTWNEAVNSGLLSTANNYVPDTNLIAEK